MEITIDLYKVGYFCGRYGTRLFIYATSAQLATKGYQKVASIARNHKIDTSNPVAVTENVFNCLKYIE